MKCSVCGRELHKENLNICDMCFKAERAFRSELEIDNCDNCDNCFYKATCGGYFKGMENCLDYARE